MRKPLISVRNLLKIFEIGDNKVYALRSIGFDVYEGEFLAIVGTSGSGKSTCLNMLAGLEKPDGGQIAIAGARIDRMNERELVRFRREHVGFIFQSYNLIASMTAVENVAMPLMFRGIPEEERICLAEQYMEEIGILTQKDHLPSQMSGGQQQRVGIARAMVIDPEIIFADEPTGNLDSKTTEEVLRLMQKLVQEKKKTLIMVTHDPYIASFADRRIRVLDGRIVAVEYKEDSEIEEEIRKENGRPPYAFVDLSKEL